MIFGVRLRALAKAPEQAPPASLQGELRPYQRTGQHPALLAHRHLEENADRPSLLVVPTSLVGNWRREAARFVPDLKLLVLHSPTGGGASRRFRTIA